MLLGAVTQLNRAYVVSKYTAPGSKARKALIPFCLYKAGQYLLAANNNFGRQRLKGVLKVLPAIRELARKVQPDLRECYFDACEKIVRSLSH